MFQDQDWNHVKNLIQNRIDETIPPPEIDLENFLESQFFHKQKEIVLCKDRFQTLFGGKRGGKSSTNIGNAFYTDQWIVPDKKGVILYMATTAEQAKRLAFAKLAALEKGFKAKWHYQMAKYTIETPSSIILFGGLKDKKAAHAFQGMPFKLVIIDEAPLINDEVLQYFIDEVVRGGLFDFAPHSRLILTGNPFPVHSGYVWECLQNPKWTHHTLNLMDNTAEGFSLEKKQKFVQEWLDSRGETMDNLSNVTRRMLFGEHVADDSLLILKFGEQDIYEELTPEQKATFDRTYDCSLGIDLGFDDKTAVAVSYYDPVKDIVYLDYEWQEVGVTIVPLANHIKKNVLTKYDTKSQNIIDTQGGGKQTAISLSKDYGIPIIPAKKGTKMHYVSLLRSYNEMHKLKVKQNSLLKNEARHIIFDKHHKKIDDDQFHSDIFHAILYDFRFLYQKYIETKQTAEKPKTPLEELQERIKKYQNFKAKPSPTDYGYFK